MKTFRIKDKAYRNLVMPRRINLMILGVYLQHKIHRSFISSIREFTCSTLNKCKPKTPNISRIGVTFISNSLRGHVRDSSNKCCTLAIRTYE